MKRKLLSVLLAISMVVSMSGTAFAAANFKDLNGHWAKTFMEQLADKGYLSGYKDGTARPDINITGCEALVFLSHFYDVNTARMNEIKDDYEAFVKKTVPTTLSWANEKVMICLAAGVLTEEELKSLKLASPIEKELLSVFFARTLQLEDEAKVLSSADLKFKDASKVSLKYARYVAALAKTGIVSGDTKNNFTPHAYVTRGVVAAMMSNSLKYLEKEGIKPMISGYGNIRGMVTSVGNNSITLRTFEGKLTEYAIPATAKVTVDGTVKTPTLAQVGYYAEIAKEETKIISIALQKETEVTWVQGVIDGISSANLANYSVAITNFANMKGERYEISKETPVQFNGQKTSMSTIGRDHFIVLKTKKSVVSEAYVFSGNYQLIGKITKLNFGAKVDFSIKTEEGDTICYQLDIAKLPKILRGERTISIDRLKVGDQVTVAVEACQIASIKTSGTEETFKGTLESITANARGTSWVIRDAGGTTKSFTVEETATVYDAQGKTILLSGVLLGDKVEVVLYGDSITEINLEGTEISTTKINGTVLAVDNNRSMITVLSNGKLIYVTLQRNANILDISDGRTMRMSGLKENESLVIYGTYKNSNTFEATSVILER